MAGKTALVAYEQPRAGEDAEERQAAHPFFITYWHPRGGKREALLWTKDEASAIGLLQSAVPGADVVEVEQREVEPGMRRGKNVYAMGGEAMETEASENFTIKTARPVGKSERMHLEEEIGMKGTLLPDGRLKWRVDDAQWAAGIRRTVDARVGAAPAFDPMTGRAMETEASEYVAVDSRGRKVFGPSKDYEQAKRHAAQAGGVVHFVMGASESCACGASDCVGVHTHGAPPRGTAVVAASEPGRRVDIPVTVDGRYYVARYKSDRRRNDWSWEIEAGGYVIASVHNKGMGWAWAPFELSGEQHYRQLGISPDASPEEAIIAAVRASQTAVVAAEGEGTPHYRELDLAPPPAPLEPYTKELRWHRDPALDSTYHAESPLGRFTVAKRTPDRRHDVLPWQVLRKGEPIGQADDKAGAYKVAAKFARSPNGRASKRVEPAACVAVVERTPGCMPTSTRLDSPKDAFEIMKGRYARQGHETFEVLGSSVQGFMVGSPITVAVGDTTSVQVSVTQVLAAAIGLSAAGATTVYCIHGHPSGKAQPSDRDRDLTRAIKAGFKVALPNVKFGGHIVAGQKTFSLA
jgi:hypothetical protein